MGQYVLTFYLTLQGQEHIWYLDSGCSRHMTRFKSLLEDYVKQDSPIVTYGDNSKWQKNDYKMQICWIQECFRCQRPETQSGFHQPIVWRWLWGALKLEGRKGYWLQDGPCSHYKSSKRYLCYGHVFRWSIIKTMFFLSSSIAHELTMTQKTLTLKF